MTVNQEHPMPDPLVSVIIPTVRRPQRLAQALASVGRQTYPAVEVVVVNDGGVSVGEVVADYRQQFGRAAQVVDLPMTGGISAARNVGARVAQGEYLALLDDDDRFRPDHLARLVAVARADPGVVVAYDTALIQIEEGAEEDAPRISATCELGLPYDQARFDQDDYILTSALLMRASAFAAVGGFDETLPFCEDWDLLLKLRARGDLRFVPGAVGVEYSMRIAANDNSGSVFDARRRAALDLLTARYGLPYLAPKTFFDVARDLGCAVVPVLSESETA